MSTLYQLGFEGEELRLQLEKVNGDRNDAVNYLSKLEDENPQRPERIALIQKELERTNALEEVLLAKITDWTQRWREAQIKRAASDEAKEQAEQAKKTATLTPEQTDALPEKPVSNVQPTGSVSAQETLPIIGQNGAATFIKGQPETDAATNNIPKTGALPEAVPVDDSLGATQKAIRDRIAPGESTTSSTPDQSDAETRRLLAAKPVEPPTPVPPLDWRVKLELASKSDWATTWFESDDAKILKPLSETKGVVFPYTPTIQMGYKAQYDSTDITHSNYKLSFYKNSYVDDISISAVFTAQDTVEANYLLATMHFFKTVTKMFYGKDTYPIAGTPPPLLFLTGYGKYQFDHLPLVLTSFTFTLPDDVDYIRTNTDKTWSGTTIGIQESNTPASPKPKSPVRDWLNKTLRLNNNNLAPGGEKVKPVFTSMNLNNNDSTYVPTKISFSLTLKPIVTRGNISKNYSTQGYAQKGGYW